MLISANGQEVHFPPLCFLFFFSHLRLEKQDIFFYGCPDNLTDPNMMDVEETY